MLSIFMTGCNNNTDDFNNNRDASYDVKADVLFTNAEKELADQITTPSVNLNPFRFFSQYWSQTTYNDESRYNLATRRVSDNHWNNLYRNVLGNLNSAKLIIPSEIKPSLQSDNEWQIQQKNKLAIIEILQVYTFQILVDSYGNIPYTESLNPENKLPKYDEGAEIYPKLILRLSAAIDDLDASGSSFTNSDYLFQGNVGRWLTFAHSLKIKLGLNLADVNPALAKTTVESGFNGGVILTNSQNASFNYPSTPPNYNPLYGDLVASNRTDFVASDVLVNAMNTLGDPRIGIYFNDYNGTYIGGLFGKANTNFSTLSRIGNRFNRADLPAELIEATEINFYLAEAAARGYSVGNSAEYYYNTAIQNSFEYYGLTPTQATAYLAKPAVAYLTATGDWKQKIGNQTWLALFNRGFESWNSYRRLDFPNLVAPTNAVAAADAQVPKRLTFPVGERTVNNTNYQAAVAAIGGLDRLKVHVFWDVN